MTPCADYLRKRFSRAARLLEFAAGLTKADAEIEAARITAAKAMDLRYPWSSLREALAEHPDLVAQIPDKQWPVDILPWGRPDWALRGAELVRLRVQVVPLVFPGPRS